MKTRPQRESWLRAPPRRAETTALRPWLRDQGSLTARIRARCRDLQVRVLAQRLCVPHRDEARLLGLRRGELAWLREVVLIADGRPVVYARSVLPRHNLRGGWRLFADIGNRPLGAALFADPRIRRAPLRVRRIDRRDPRLARAGLAGVDTGAVLWARRSVFRRRGRALLVCEVFLPAIMDLHPCKIGSGPAVCPMDGAGNAEDSR
ncbi:MAG: chorismate lyase [Rhodocyclaceae bacterium]|nr:chorismate lyase [Rhodocyclaceae bacterium]